MKKKFLIIRWSGMGDIVMSLPAAKWLKENFDDCHISYLTDTAFSTIPDMSGFIDRVETIDRRGFEKKSRFIRTLWGAILTLKRLRRNRFDIIFDLQGFGETAIIALLAGAPIRVGRIKDSPLRKRIYNSAITADWEKVHRIHFFIKAVSKGCGMPSPDLFEFPVLLLPDKIEKRKNLIGLNIGASTESRRWSERNFFELSKRLSLMGFSIRFFLGPQESFLVPETKKICLENNWNFFSGNSLESLISGISECSLLVSNDTGPGHVAAAIGIPVITLFSRNPTNTHMLTPIKDSHRIAANTRSTLSLALA